MSIPAAVKRLQLMAQALATPSVQRFVMCSWHARVWAGAQSPLVRSGWLMVDWVSCATGGLCTQVLASSPDGPGACRVRLGVVGAVLRGELPGSVGKVTVG